MNRLREFTPKIDLIPVLDAELETLDFYLAELAARAIADQNEHTHRDAVLEWVN